MIKLFLTLLLISLPSLGFAEPYLSPEGCKTVTTELYETAILRDQGIPMEVLLEMVKGDEVANKFYQFHIKTIYSSKMKPEDIAQSFFTLCYDMHGDVAKLYGSET